jgi:flagellar operon protein
VSTTPLSVESIDYSRMLPRIKPTARGLTPSAPGTKVQEGSGHTAFEHALERVLAPTDADPTESLSVVEEGEEGPNVQFSRHALGRVESRGIELSDTDLEEIADAIDRLAEKDAQESLLLMGDTAFIVGVPKRTVITAMSRKDALGSVFTNIDSAMVLR